MTIEEIVKLRTALKAGGSVPVRVMMNNTYTIIDESNPAQFTKWDDTNGVLYSFRLVDQQSDIYPGNNPKYISVFAVDYEYIEAMEVAMFPLADIDKLFATIEATGATMADEFKTRIKTTFENLLDTNRAELTREEINKLTGASLDTSDDYYAGRFNQNFKETRMMAEHNAYVDQLKKEEESKKD